jgi:glycosyltransferase involved in cell wall biosynthesis
MINKKSLAVLIPTRNRSSSLKKLLESMMRQTLGKNIVVYVRDNNSSDNTEDIVEEYKKIYSNLVYHKNEINIGPSANFMMLVQNCKEDYFWLFGDDDMIHEDGLDKVMHIIGDNPDYLVFRDRYGQYESLRDYVLDGLYSNPHGQIYTTLITCNIIKRAIFDIDFATSKYTTHYCHMYGIMKGLSDGAGRIIAKRDKEFFQRCRNGAPIDGDWPVNLEIEWVRYLKFLVNLVEVDYPWFKMKMIHNKWKLKCFAESIYKHICK